MDASRYAALLSSRSYGLYAFSPRTSSSSDTRSTLAIFAKDFGAERLHPCSQCEASDT